MLVGGLGLATKKRFFCAAFLRRQQLSCSSIRKWKKLFLSIFTCPLSPNHFVLGEGLESVFALESDVK